jgi:hypothetical protein
MIDKLKVISNLYYNPDLVRRQLPSSPEDYTEFRKCYFVMQPHETFHVPRWFDGDLTLTSVGTETRGRFTVHKFKGEFIADTEDRYHFDVFGELFKGYGPLNRIFQFEAWGQNHNNTIQCTFNMIASDPDDSTTNVLVGVWSGRDDKGLPTTAPMVLSRDVMPIDNVRMIVNRVAFRCLPNAETNGDGDYST